MDSSKTLQRPGRSHTTMGKARREANAWMPGEMRNPDQGPLRARHSFSVPGQCESQSENQITCKVKDRRKERGRSPG